MMPLEPPVQRAAADAEHLRRRHAIAVDLPQYLEDVRALDLVEMRRRFRGARRLESTAAHADRRLGTESARELALRDQRPVGQHAGALDDVLHLANVAVPARV